MKVDPERYLEHLRVAHNVPALTYEGVHSVNVALLNQIAEGMIQKLSLIYGFPYDIDQEEAEPWVAAAPPTEHPQHARPYAFYYHGVGPFRHAIRPGGRKRKPISARRDP